MARRKLKGGVWYYRARVPADVRGVLRRGELVVSLGTADPLTAEARALELSAAQLRLCRTLRQAGPMTTDQVDQLVAHYMASFRANREDDAIQLPTRTAKAVSERQAWVANELAAAELDLAHHRLASTERLAQELLHEAGTSFGVIGDDAFRRLCFRLLGARVDVMREEAKRLPSPAFSGTAGAPAVAPQSPLLSELVGAYLTHRDTTDPMRPNSRTEMAAALKVLVSSHVCRSAGARSTRTRRPPKCCRKLKAWSACRA
jgi:hypothetical protein